MTSEAAGIDWISLLSGLGGVIAGSLVTYGLWHFQDRTNRRREWVAEHLRRVYYKLIDASSAEPSGEGQSLHKKQAFADVFNEILLLGNPETIKIAENLLSDLIKSEKTHEWVPFEPLFAALISQLRDELGLEPSNKHSIIIAYSRPENTDEETRESTSSEDS